jgi:Bor protein
VHAREFCSGAALAGLLLLSACHSMRFEVGEGPVGKVVHDRKSFFIAGLVTTQHVDVAQFCPNGAVAISEETTFVDGLFSFFTLSIYTPRSSTYHCAADGQ